jgi:RNA polymerase sigma-70 factor (ECF subfamily)
MTSPDDQFGGIEARELLQRARDGDPEAFCSLAQAHEQRLFQQALALCRNPATAEDIAAETLIEAWKSIARFDGQCRFSTWLYAILLHRHQKQVRKQQSRPVPLSALSREEADRGRQWLECVTDSRPESAQILAQSETDASLREAVNQLPGKHRQVILLRFFESAALPEIAAALGLSVGTVKSRLHHALGKLRKMKTIVNLFKSPGDKES